MGQGVERGLAIGWGPFHTCNGAIKCFLFQRIVSRHTYIAEQIPDPFCRKKSTVEDDFIYNMSK